jgi:hypothetical protein
MAGDNSAMFVDWLGVPHEAFLRYPGASGAPTVATQIVNVIAVTRELSAGRALELAREVLRVVGPIDASASAVEERLEAQVLGTRAPLAQDVQVRQSPDFFTRIDALALRDVLEGARRARSLTWREVAQQIALPDVVSASSLASIGGRPAPRDLARRDLGARVGVHPFTAVVQWIGVPSELFMARPPGRRQAGVRDQLTAVVRLRNDLPDRESSRLTSLFDVI